MAGHKIGAVLGNVEAIGDAGLQADIVAAIETANAVVWTILIWHTHTPALVAGLRASLPVMLLKVGAQSEFSVCNGIASDWPHSGRARRWKLGTWRPHRWVRWQIVVRWWLEGQDRFWRHRLLWRKVIF
jgi:hypothetical protein